MTMSCAGCATPPIDTVGSTYTSSAMAWYTHGPKTTRCTSKLCKEATEAELRSTHLPSASGSFTEQPSGVPVHVPVNHPS